MVAVLTSGTMTDAEMLQSHPDASYLMAITESALAPGPDSIDAAPVTVGVCAVDAATGQMLLGQWCAYTLYHVPLCALLRRCLGSRQGHQCWLILEP